MKTCVQNEDKRTCSNQCLGESGKDDRDKGKIMVKYEKEKGKESIKSCEDQGTDLKACLKTEFNNKPEKRKGNRVHQRIYL